MNTVVVDQVAPQVHRVMLDRPESLNAMTAELIADLLAAFEQCEADPDCRVVVLTGAGRAFCAGLDLKGFGELPGDDARGPAARDLALQRRIASLVPAMRRMTKPIIAAVNGAAAGGGLALVLASDIRVAARSARFNAAFVRIGLSGCDISTSWTLPRLVGAGRAHEMMLTGRFVEADEAERIGLVLEVVDDAALLAAALVHAGRIVANSPMGVASTKAVMWAALEGSQQAAIALENHTQILLVQTRDAREARRAFLAKRPPSFENG